MIEARGDRAPPDASASSAGPEDRHGALFWFATAAGWAIIGFGLLTLFQRSGATRPANFATLFVGLALAHDLVLAPLVTALAVTLGPRIPRSVRGAVFGGLMVSGVLVLVSLPVLLGDRPGDNPSLLPRNYPLGLALSLALTWGAAGAVALLAIRRRRR
jgi:hypothetical protein